MALELGVKCVACDMYATFKDYRFRADNLTTGYPVCSKHLAVDDLTFWRAFNKKQKVLDKTRNKG